MKGTLISTFAPLKPHISVPELDYRDLQLESASSVSLMATGKIPTVVGDLGTQVYNVFISKFIGLLEIYFNGCGVWRLTEFKDFDNGQHIVEFDAVLPRISSENLMEFLQATGILVHRAHNKIKQWDDSDWQLSVRLVEYVDTRELAKKYNLLEEA